MSMNKLWRDFPYLSVEHSYLIFRWTLAGLFMAHAVLRFTVPDYFHTFGDYLEKRNAILPYALPYIATLIEIVGGLLLIFNRLVKWVALGFFAISFGGILTIHARLGWFVGEWGEGGCEYSVALCVMCLLLASMDREKERGKEEQLFADVAKAL
jgi:putative oxidoreductase